MTRRTTPNIIRLAALCRRGSYLFVLVLAACQPVYVSAGSPTAPRYRLVDLHDFETGWSFTRRINNRGHVIGELNEGLRPSRGFFWTPEMGMQIVPELDPVNLQVNLNEINNLDQFVGKEGIQSLVWDGVTPPTNLQTIIGPSVRDVWDLNDRGQFLINPDDFLSGSPHDAVGIQGLGVVLPDPPGTEERVRLSEINNAGIVAGSIERDGPTLPFLWDVESDEYSILPIATPDVFAAAGLDVIDIRGARANQINDNGDVVMAVSVSLPTVRTSAVVLRFADGRTVGLGNVPVPEATSPDGYSFPTYAALNNRRQLVGAAQILGAIPGENVPFIWDEYSGLQLLSDLLDESADGWEFVGISDINDYGYITGWGHTPTGTTHAFVLVPVPEPAAVSLLAMGGAVAMALKRRLARPAMCG